MEESKIQDRASRGLVQHRTIKEYQKTSAWRDGLRLWALRWQMSFERLHVSNR